MGAAAADAAPMSAAARLLWGAAGRGAWAESEPRRIRAAGLVPERVDAYILGCQGTVEQIAVVYIGQSLNKGGWEM